MTNYQHYLHQQALKVAACYRQTESELLEILQKIDKQRVYRQLGYASLFVYATQALKLSEAVAYSFIQVARKATEVPELKAAIQQGTITVSKVHRIIPLLTPINQGQLLEMVKTLPKRELEREVAKLNPLAIVPEKMRYVTAERLELKLGVSEALMQQLKRVQDLLSTQRRRAVSMEETLACLTEEYLDKHDPLKKAERVQERLNNVGSVLCPGTKQLEAERRQITIPALVKHTVILRDAGRCTYVDPQGKRCSEQRWLDLHHQTPKGEGGIDSADNLTLLCAGHHRVIHHASR